MFSTVKYLFGVGVVTFLCGHDTLARLAAKRKQYVTGAAKRKQYVTGFSQTQRVGTGGQLSILYSGYRWSAKPKQ